jgi:hypothetical protein
MRRALALKEVLMKKTIKKLTLHRETLCALTTDLHEVVGAVATAKTVCATACVTNCAACYFTPGTNCC